VDKRRASEELEQTDEECSEVGGCGADCNEEPGQREELIARRVNGQHTAGHLYSVEHYHGRLTTKPTYTPSLSSSP